MTNQARTTNAEKVWKAHGLKAVAFKAVDMKAFRDTSCSARLWFLITIVFSLQMLYGYASDAFFCYAMLQQDNIKASITYFVAIGISFLLLYRELKEANQIMDRGDISESFCNTESYRWRVLHSYNTYSFYRKIGLKLNRTDRMARFIFFTIKRWQRILFVNWPQFFVAVALIKDNNADNAASELKGLRLAAYVIKVVVLTRDTISLAVSLVLYPCVVFVLNAKFRSMSFELREYVLFQIDTRINQLLGLIADPDNPGLKPTIIAADAAAAPAAAASPASSAAAASPASSQATGPGAASPASAPGSPGIAPAQVQVQVQMQPLLAPQSQPQPQPHHQQQGVSQPMQQQQQPVYHQPPVQQHPPQQQPLSMVPIHHASPPPGHPQQHAGSPGGKPDLHLQCARCRSLTVVPGHTLAGAQVACAACSTLMHVPVH